MTRVHRTVLGMVALALAAGAIGCGSASSGSGEIASSGGPGSRLVDASRPPYILGFAVDPGDGSFVLATNKGLYDVPKQGGREKNLRAAVKAGTRNGAFGKEVSALAFSGPGKLIGSGHPDAGGGELPGFLGLIASDDGGRTWDTISRSGLSDLHVLLVSDKRIVAFDTTLGGVIVSTDGGKTWKESGTPQGLVLDMGADPANPRALLAATADSLYLTTDEGESWKKLGPANQAKLSWTPRRLVRAVSGGQVATSADGGKTWTPAGKLPRTAGKLVEGADGTLYAALDNGSIVSSSDTGKTWKAVYTP
jgi:BNR/Asp-box repeat